MIISVEFFINDLIKDIKKLYKLFNDKRTVIATR